MKTLRFSASRASILMICFTLVVNLLALQIPHFDPLKAVLGFIWLVVLPGWLITRIFRLRTAHTWERFGFIIGFGLISVMLMGLATNAVLPLIGDPQPLDITGLLFCFDIAWIALIVVDAWRNASQEIIVRLPQPHLPGITFAAAGLPTVILAVFGAITLNNQGSNFLTVLMLCYTTVYLTVMIYLRDRLPQAALLTGLYQVALAILLMTSLRGWYITGHDIQREYRVFLLSLTNLRWNMASFRDAYNACMSITILPTVFRQIMGIPEVYVYKTVFQAIFAIVPVMIFLIAKRHAGSLAAILGSIYFVSFPTYFGDMPMLNRQEIAFVFVSLMLLALFSTSWSLRRRRWTVGILGLGVVLSHYSTTYTMIAIFGVVIGLRFFLKILAKRIHSPKLRDTLGLNRWYKYHSAPVNLALIAALLGFSYLWSTQLTNTGGNISRVITATLTSIRSGIGSDSKSSDTSYSLFGKPQMTDQQRLDAYIKKTLPAKRAEAGVGRLYPPSTYEQYAPKIAPVADLPLTDVGHFLQSHSVSVTGINSILRQGSAVFLQLMLILGILILFLVRPHKTQLDNEYRLFQLAGIIFVVAIITLPVLSAEYGLLRAFQQILILGGSTIAIATLALVPKRFALAGKLFASTLAIGFFVVSSGMVTAFLGGYPGQLNLANSGKYFDLYYAHESEQKAIAWLSVTTAQPSSADQVSSSIETDRYTVGRLSVISDLNVQDGIYPGTVPKDAYVFVGRPTLVDDVATVYYNGDPLSYYYPMKFLNDNKDLVYSNGGARIYR